MRCAESGLLIKFKNLDILDGEIEEFLGEFDHIKNLNFVKFLFFTGCRPSEAIGLEWQNVTKDYILFKDAIIEREYQNHTKTRKSRKFPINEQLAEILKEIDKESNYVFVAKEKRRCDRSA